MGDPEFLAGNVVLVLTSDWAAGEPYIRYFPDQPCLDFSSNNQVVRDRLSNPIIIGTRPDCETGAPFEVTRCDVS
jgi:hypothetical protein